MYKCRTFCNIEITLLTLVLTLVTLLTLVLTLVLTLDYEKSGKNTKYFGMSRKIFFLVIMYNC